MASCILYYGPGAKGEALEEAYRIGELVAPPFGDAGLKVAEAREIVRLMDIPPFEGVGVVVAGPMELATYKANDALLKSIEEFDAETMQPILWANELEEVAPTIRSRCLERWAWLDPDDEEIDEDRDAIEAAGRGLVRSALDGDLWAIPDYVNQHKGALADLLGIAAGAIVDDPSERALRLWGSLRKVAKRRNPRPVEVIAAFLGLE
jgi:hypothetical protein